MKLEKTKRERINQMESVMRVDLCTYIYQFVLIYSHYVAFSYFLLSIKLPEGIRDKKLFRHNSVAYFDLL